MNRKLNIDDLKKMVKDCVYEEKNIVCMNNQYYRKLIKRMNNLQSKIDKANEILDKDTNVENIYFELRDLFKGDDK